MHRPTLLKSCLLFFMLTLLVSCDSYFGFSPLDEAEVIDPDDEIIVDPFDEDDLDDPQSFGVSNSFCYGFSEPTEDYAIVDTDIEFLESVDLSMYLPPVGSQGTQGSCVAWATGYYLKSFHENMEDSNNGVAIVNNQMSPAFVYNQIKAGSCADGSSIPDALKLISDTGIVTWQEMPYNQNECNTQPSAAQNVLAGSNKIMSYAPLNGDKLFEQAKASLMNNQPVVVAISIDNEHFGAIDNKGDAAYREFGGVDAVDGAHAMLVVGYDDAKTAFKVVNSWGKNWGNDGFVWIDYKAFQEVLDSDSNFKILCEAWISDDIIQF